jgi:hypothetical protein
MPSSANKVAPAPRQLEAKTVAVIPSSGPTRKGWRHRLAHYCRDLLANAYFDNFVLVVILANSICLAIDNPTEEKEDKVLQRLDILFTVIFVVEMVVKVTALGFWKGPLPCMRRSADPKNATEVRNSTARI